MHNFPNPTPSPKLRAIFNPPDLVSGTPNEVLSLGVVVENVGDRDAIIDVFINEDSDSAVLQWCRVPRQRLALNPKQQEELVFDFTLPATAAAATYDYTVVIDAPEGYPEESPIQYPLQLRVLFKEQTVIRANDPTFFISPATNPQKPAPLHPGSVLQFQIRVDNRSNLVDKYRLSCPDLEEDWLKIHHPKSNLGGVGLVAEPDSLELNPYTQGIIHLDICPPAEALAGIYIPNIFLHSVNLPDLRRLDCIYFEIQQLETLSVEMETIIGRISHTSGQYRLNLKNTGNVIRQLRFGASSRDEDEICTYRFDPPTVRLLPNQSAQVLLLVTPNQPKHRPFWGMGQTINFQVALHDADGYQIPDLLPQGSLTWKARPWWQLLLLILLVLGLLTGAVLLVRWLLRSEPDPNIADFKSTSQGYQEGDPVQLEWTVNHSKTVEKMVVTATPTIQPAEIAVDPNQCAADSAQPDQIRCKVSVGVLRAQQYNFALKTVLHNGQPLQPDQTTTVAIAPKPPPAIDVFQSTKNSYPHSEPVRFNWKISNSDQLNGLTLIATNAKNQANINIPLLRSKTGQGIRSQDDIQLEAGISGAKCSVDNKTGVLACTAVPVSMPRAGDYTFKLQVSALQPQGASPRPPVEKSTGTVTVQPQQLVLIASVNGESDPLRGIELKQNDNNPLHLSWQVNGGEGNVQVLVQGNTQPKAGDSTMNPPLPGQSLTITFIASDESGNPPQQRTFTVTRLMPTPTPTPTPTLTLPFTISPPRQR